MITSQKNYQWITSLYFFQSMPFVVVSLIATIIYQQYGMTNAHAALLTSLLMLPWAIKPLFSPLLEHLATKKRLTIYAQAVVSLIFIILACYVNNPYFLIISSLGFACLAFISSFHDIVADGVYLLNLNDNEQKRYVALRSFFYQMGRLVIKGGLLALIGKLALHYELNIWRVFFCSLSVITFLLALYHKVKIPERQTIIEPKVNYVVVLKSLLLNSKIYPLLIFIFLYNFSDAQMQRIIPLFLMDQKGMGLSLGQLGELYGISGSIALMTGIFISGLLISHYAIEKCMKNATIPLLLGHLFFLLLTIFISNHYLLYAAIIFNQFTVGMANGAYMGYLLKVANKSDYPMSMYTVCTSLMALSYVVFGAFSGWIEQYFGYSGFFLYIFIINLMLVAMTYRVMNNHA